MGKRKLAFVNKDMLIWARQQTPFAKSIDLLVEKFKDLDCDNINRWENGETLPSIREAKRLAFAYKLPFACFFLSEPLKKRPKKYIDRRTFLGTDYQEMSYDLWAEITRIESDRDTLLQFYKLTSYKINTLPKIDTDNIENIASVIRKYLGLALSFKNKSVYEGNSFSYFKRILEAKDIMVAQISHVSLTEMKGLSIYEDLFPIVAINNKDFERAKTFSLFHEVAHLVRRSSSLCLINYDERNDNEEKICDRIAASVLMESSEFLKISHDIFSRYKKWDQYSLGKLADRFGVSIVSAFRRLYDLKVISKNQYYKMYDDINKDFNDYISNAKKNINVRVDFYIKYVNIHGRLMPKMIVSAANMGKITVGEACKIMNIKSKHYDKIVEAVMR